MNQHHLVDRLIKASTSRAENPGFESHLRRDFSGSSHTSDVKISIPVATLPGAWRDRMRAGTGWPGVCILWVRWEAWSAASISVWQHVKWSEQIGPWDTSRGVTGRDTAFWGQQTALGHVMSRQGAWRDVTQLSEVNKLPKVMSCHVKGRDGTGHSFLRSTNCPRSCHVTSRGVTGQDTAFWGQQTALGHVMSRQGAWRDVTWCWGVLGLYSIWSYSYTFILLYNLLKQRPPEFLSPGQRYHGRRMEWKYWWKNLMIIKKRKATKTKQITTRKANK